MLFCTYFNFVVFIFYLSLLIFHVILLLQRNKECYYVCVRMVIRSILAVCLGLEISVCDYNMLGSCFKQFNYLDINAIKSMKLSKTW